MPASLIVKLSLFVLMCFVVLVSGVTPCETMWSVWCVMSVSVSVSFVEVLMSTRSRGPGSRLVRLCEIYRGRHLSMSV